MKYFEKLHTLAEIKREYHRLTKLHHPDVGGDTATMQEINRQYKEALAWIEKHGEGKDRQDAAQEVPEEFMAAVAAVVNLDGIILDLVGAWIWATGNTRTHKEALKAAGFRWASKKFAWYWRPEWAAVGKGSKKSLDEIKDKYGSERIMAGTTFTRRVLTA